MKLLVISHTPHFKLQDEIYGWGATVREIDNLTNIFSSVIHIAPLHNENPSPSQLPYQSGKVIYYPVNPAGGESLQEKTNILWTSPDWVKAIKKFLPNTDAIHIRCPANISLIGLLSIKILRQNKPVWVKYAGNWNSYKKEPLSYQIQRLMLRKQFIRCMISINGSFSDSQQNVFSFYNPSLYQSEYDRAKKIAAEKSLVAPIQLIFVGRLIPSKGVDRLLNIASMLNKDGIDFILTLVGDGPNRKLYESFVASQGLTERVHFVGWKPMPVVFEYYRKAHFIVLPSMTEGWPKVLSEGMAHGVVPIASAVGSIPQILNIAHTGASIPYDDISAFHKVIKQYIENPQKWKQESQNASVAGDLFTYDTYLQKVKNLFKKGWNIEL